MAFHWGDELLAIEMFVGKSLASYNKDTSLLCYKAIVNIKAMQ